VELVPVEVLKEGAGVPLCCVHDGFGLSWSYLSLVDYLDCPIIGINQITHNGEPRPGSIRSMAATYADRLQAIYPTGPYKLLGWSFGGFVAHELAIELGRRGCVVQRLILLDPRGAHSALRSHAFDESQVLEHFSRPEQINSPQQSAPVAADREEGLIYPEQEAVTDLIASHQQILELVIQNANANLLLLCDHSPSVFGGEMVIFWAGQAESENGSAPQHIWQRHVAGDITEHSVDCAHYEMLTARSLSIYAEQLKHSLEA
jgi:thioesterase domain-containing protein